MSAEEIVRMECDVSGRVQRVMFRDFACRGARSLGVVGTVENMPDGTVHVIAEGERDKLDALVERLHKGSLLSKVEGVAVCWKPASGVYDRFVIVY